MFLSASLPRKIPCHHDKYLRCHRIDFAQRYDVQTSISLSQLQLAADAAAF